MGVRRLLDRFVESLGFRAQEAASAEESLEIVRNHSPDMVLLGVRLPGMNGTDALAEIRKIADKLPVLLVTAYADLRQAVAAMKGGEDDHFTKPVELDELETAIADVIGPVATTPGDMQLPKLPSWFVCKSRARDQSTRSDLQATRDRGRAGAQRHACP